MIVSFHASIRFHSSSPHQIPLKTQNLSSLLKCGFVPSIQSLNLLLSSLLRARKPQLVLQIFTQISSNSIPIDSRTHSLVARALLKARRFKEAEQFISHAEKYDLLACKSLWDSLIRRVCVTGGDPEKALSLLNECVKNRGVCPSPDTFRSLIFSFSSRGEMERAIEVLEAMNGEKIRYPFDNFVCSSIISGFCKIGKPELGLGFYERVERTNQFRPNLVTYTAVLNALCREGRVDEAGHFVSKMEKDGVVLDAVLYSSWICGYLRKGVLMEGLRKHRLMVENEILPDVVSYTNLIDGLCKEGDVEKVIGFLYEMEKTDIKPTVVTYTVLIKGFCKRGKLEEAFCVLRKLEELGIKADKHVYSILINGLCRKGDLDGVFGLLEELERKGIEVGLVAYNTVINGLCKVGKTCKADEISRDFSGDNFTFSALLHGYMKEMDVRGVMETKKRLEAADIFVDVVTCNVLIKAMFMMGLVEDASVLFDEMPKKGIVANFVSYYTMVDAYCKVGMLDKALEIFDKYKRNSSISNAACHDRVIRELCKEHLVELAIQVFRDLIERNLVADCGTYGLLIRASFKDGNGEGVLKFIHKIEKLDPKFLSTICNDAVAFLSIKGCFAAALNIYIFLRGRGLALTSKVYYVLLRRLIRTGNKQIVQLLMRDYIKIYGVFEHRMMNVMALYLCQNNVEDAICFLSDMGKENISITVFTAVIDALKKEGRVQDALNFLMEAEKYGPLDLVVYAIVVDGLCKEGYLEKALYLCSSMSKKGIHPNIVIYNSVINGLCQQGCLVEAFRLFDSLEYKSVFPTTYTYATVIGALSREGLLQDASKLFERMVLKGIAPNTRVYNILINGYCSFGLMEEALKVLSNMEVSYIQPDAFTVSAMISGYCLKGDIESALCFFGEYRRNGFSPDFLGFMNLIKGLIAKGRMEEARTNLRDMLHCVEIMDLINRAGDGLHVESLVSLLALACDQGRIQEVVDVLSEVGYVSFSSWRSNSNYRLKRLKELHEKGILDTNIGDTSPGKAGIYPMTFESTYGSLKRQSITNNVVDISHSINKLAKENNSVEDYEHLMVKSLHYDFDTYYPIIASLCSKGELQKANEIVNTMLLNSGEIS